MRLREAGGGYVSESHGWEEQELRVSAERNEEITAMNFIIFTILVALWAIGVLASILVLTDPVKSGPKAMPNWMVALAWIWMIGIPMVAAVFLKP